MGSKKQKIVLQKERQQQPANPFSTITITKQDTIPALLIFLYTITEFVPKFNGGDVMGSQWLYINVLNIISIICIIYKKKLIADQAINNIIKSIPSLLYFFVVLLAGISFIIALNKTETLVNYARLINTIIMFIILAILLYGRLNLFSLLAQLFSIYLLIQSISTISTFYKGLEETDINKLILGLTGNAGNKNILAVSLVIKIPFVIYCIYTCNNWRRLLNLPVLALGAFAVFILNARASYVGLLVALLIFIVTIIFLNYRHHLKRALLNVLLITLPVAVAFMVSLAVIKNAIAMQDQETGYGTVIERLNSISLTAEGSNSRTQMWGSAITHIKKNPLLGCGYGNWKLASIPYEKTYADEFLVAYHTHNDFLEITAELGIAGGLSYCLIFIFLSFYLLKIILSSARNFQSRIIAIIFLMALAVYFIDAFLNFPMERPVMQFFFALIFAVSLILFRLKNDNEDAANDAKQTTKNKLGLICLLVLLPSAYITYSTYKSFVVQVKVNQDLKRNTHEVTSEEIMHAFPSIPNMNAFCYPTDHIKAIYLIEDKQYDKALPLLDKGTAVNPYLPLAEFYKARIFLETNKLDSAFIYANKAFFIRPRARSSYELLNDISIRRGDTVTLGKAFKEYITYRNEPWAWNRYLDIMMYMQQNQQPLLAIADSALKLFPSDPDLQQKKNTLSNASQSKALTAEQDAEFQKYFAVGLAAFNNKSYPVAIENFTRAAKAYPGDYVAVENIGVCYYSMGNYLTAISYFDKVLERKVSTDGKSEFLKGVCLLNLTKKEEACYYLNLANNKNYSGAIALIQANCK